MMPSDMTPIDAAVMWLIGVFLALCCIHASYLLATAVERISAAWTENEPTRAA